jgi:hypothetical protein
MFGLELDILVLAMKCRGDDLAAELEQVGTDLATCEGQRIEGVEIDVGGYRDYNPATRMSVSNILQSSIGEVWPSQHVRITPQRLRARLLLIRILPLHVLHFFIDIQAP